MSFLPNLQAAHRPQTPILLGARLAASPGLFISPTIGTPSILLTVAILFGPTATTITAPLILIARDQDMTDPANLTGEPLWTWTGDILIAGRRWPTFDHRAGPVIVHPRRLIRQVPAWIKVRLDVSVVGAADYGLLFRLAPLDGLTP